MSGFERRGSGTSFLVRLWREPRSDSGPEGPPRVYVRDLRSGDERYLKDIEALSDFLERHEPAPRRRAGAEHRDADGRRRAG